MSCPGLVKQVGSPVTDNSFPRNWMNFGRASVAPLVLKVVSQPNGITPVSN